MTLRVLYWNIENLTGGRLADPDVMSVVSTTLAPGGQPCADLYVIVEAYNRANLSESGVIYPDGPGQLGLLRILEILNGNANPPPYVCVPPVTVGDAYFCESVGLIYRTAMLEFLGPHVWSNVGPVPLELLGLTLMQAETLGAGDWLALMQYWGVAQIVPAPYEVPWNNGPFSGPAIHYLAPQIRYPVGTPPQFLRFPNDVHRPPFCGRFRIGQPVQVGTSVVLPELDVYAVHTSPPGRGAGHHPNNPGTAVLAMQAIGQIPALQAGAESPHGQLVIGDFNVESDSTWAYAAAYEAFARGFTFFIGDTAGSRLPRGTPTHYNRKSPRPWFDARTPRGYFDTSIDNALLGPAPSRYGPFLTGAVVDRVAGTPPGFSSALLRQPLSVYGPAYSSGERSSFQGWDNIGHIAARVYHNAARYRIGASDHLPLYLALDWR